LRNECGTVLDPGVLLLLCEERDRDHWCALAQRGAVYFTFSSDLVDLQVILERGACRCSVMVVGESEAFAALWVSEKSGTPRRIFAIAWF
jgi:hypothetical protein